MTSLPSSSRSTSAIPQNLRHIKIFSTPAGTPSVSGKDTRVSNWFRWFPSYVQHWGIFVESQTDGLTGGTFFELAFPGGVLGIMKRTKIQRETEEKNNGRWMKWEDTNLLTSWTDENIEYEATRLCRDELQRDYDVRQRNCQTFVNLLLQKIVYGPLPYTPRHTASHAFWGNGPSDEHLIVTHPDDQAKATPFQGTKTFKLPAWNEIGAAHEHLWKEKEKVSIPVGAEGYIDLNDAQRPEGPGTIDRTREIALAYARGKAGAPKPDWVEPPSFSLGMPPETRKALKEDALERTLQSDSAFKAAPERFIGPRTAHVQHVADSVDNFFHAQIERTRIFNERDAEFERWRQSGKLSDADLRLKWEELQQLNSITLRANINSSKENHRKDQEFYKQNEQRRRDEYRRGG